MLRSLQLLDEQGQRTIDDRSDVAARNGVPQQILCEPQLVVGLLRSVSEFVFSKKTLEHVVDPIIADMQAEYFEALEAKRRYKARWVLIRGHWSFFKTVGLHSIVKAVFEVWRKVSAG